MFPLAPIVGAVAVCLTGFGTCFGLSRLFRAPDEAGKFAQIDGLRGVLAFSVFLHHAEIWSRYLKTGSWHLSESNLFVHLGQSSVSLFFMITSFLFIRKLAAGGKRPVDWRRLYLHRVFRLTPLYLTAMGLLLLIVVVESSGKLNERFDLFLLHAAQWMGFGLFGTPEINKVPTERVVAGVIWSLQYEWAFYLLLPLIAIAFRKRIDLYLLVPCSMIAIASSPDLVGAGRLLTIFCGGAIAAFLEQSPAMRRFARSGTSLVLISLSLAVLLLFDSAYDLRPTILLSLIFVLVACGNTIHGFLVLPALLFLGELTYAIYLFHGMILFGMFALFFPASSRMSMSAPLYWTCVVLLTPVVMLASVALNRLIERPGIEHGKIVDRWLSTHLAKRPWLGADA